MKKSFSGLWISAGIILIILLPFCLIAFDSFLFGDELISYSMANNDMGGFVFSEGRVASYLQNELLADNLSATIANFYDFLLDILNNGKQASFFVYPREAEIEVFSNQQIHDWFFKRSDERFNFGTTWAFSLSDNANSYFYYCILNLLSSIFITLSGTKWVGFIANYVFYDLCLLLIYCISRKIGLSKNKALLSAIIWATSVATIVTVTYIRAYILATFFSLLLVLLHINLVVTLQKEKDSPIGRILTQIFVVYVFGYISHYTNLIVWGSLGLVTFIFSLYTRIEIKKILQYCLSMVCAFVVGFLLDPTSILGLVSKFLNTGGTQVSAVSQMVTHWNDLCSYIFPNTVIFCIVFIAMITSVFITIRKTIWNKENPHSHNPLIIYLACVTAIFFVVVLLGTKRLDYGRILFPVVAILCVETTDSFFRHVIHYRKLASTAAVSIVLITVICGIHGGIQRLAQDNTINAGMSEALNAYHGSDVVYFRCHGNGYTEATHLQHMNSAQVITINTQNWENIADPDFTTEDHILVFFTPDTYNSATTEWITQAGYDLGTCLYDEYSNKIFFATQK